MQQQPKEEEEETNVTLSLESSLKSDFKLPLHSQPLPVDIKQRYLKEFDRYAFYYFGDHDYSAYKLSVQHLWIYGEKNLFETLTEEEKQEMYFKPNRVDKVFHFENGENDENPWIVIGSLKGYPEIFFYFDAWCDYTGFSCEGGVFIRYSKSFDSMMRFGLDERLRKCLKK